MVVLDTCAIIESCKKACQLTKKTLTLMEKGSYILTISFAEIACKVRLNKLEIGMTPRMLFNEFRQIQNIQLIDIGIDEWLDSIDLDWEDNRDPADRMITAFAMKHSLPIVTSDKKIKHFYKNAIW